MQAYDFVSEVMPRVVRRARFKFKTREQRDDVLSMAWELWRVAPGAHPDSLAYYACRRVKVELQFRESARSVTGPASRNNPKPERQSINVAELVSDDENPSLIAALLIDAAAWLPTLTERERQIVYLCLSGESTSEVAKRFAVSWGRISQIRRHLVKLWNTFTESDTD